jgi:PKD repeat protein
VRILALALLLVPSARTTTVFSVSGSDVLLNGKPFKVIGLRLSNALISDAETQEVVDLLDVYKSYGVNLVSAYFMGSRFGDLKGYRPDASLNPTVADRMGRLIRAADARGMVVLVGCLYWSTSRAKEDLGSWGQAQANAAVANTVRWLKDNNYRNVFVDPDNEGMSPFSIAQMIDAAHAVDRTIMVCANETNTAPAQADLLVHHSPKVAGKPWIQTEGAPSGYWGTYSKETHEKTGYYNYSRIGRYTVDMKEAQISQAKSDIGQRNGYVLASTWLQCAPNEGVGGPFHKLGGRSNIADVNANIDTLHPDAGVLWWLEAMKSAYGAWSPPAGSPPANVPPRSQGSATPSSGAPPLAVRFSSSGSSDPDGSIVAWRWSFGDGATSTDPNPSHTYAAEGSYSAALRVTDDDGASSTSAPIAITVAAPGSLAVTSLTLMNADSDLPIYDPFRSGAVLNLGTLPTRNLSVRANAAGAVGSVRFAYDATSNYRTENTAPYAIAGDATGDLNPWTPSVGSHSVTATPYSLSNAGGAAGAPQSATFTVLDEPGTPSSNGGGGGGAAPPSAPSSGPGASCGALGVEAAVLLGLARLLRRPA